jgi:hypothetical protein
MIYFAELFMTGGQHAAFNAGMLQVFAKAFPSQNIKLFAVRNHYQQLEKHIGSASSFVWSPTYVLSNKSGNILRWILKFINEFLQIFRILFAARVKSVELVYFAFLSPIGQYVVSLYARYFPIEGQQIIITLHGLDILREDKPRKRIDRFYAKLLKRAFSYTGKYKRYVVLEERVANYLLTEGHLQQKEIIQIPHPYQFDVQPVAKLNTPLVFAHLGVARLDKHAAVFFELAARCSEMVKEGKVIFQVIGPVLPEMKPYLNPWVKHVSTEVMLDHATYRQQCLQAHYAVFFYDESSYTLTSSGAIIDAIAYQLPILALHSPAFDALLPIKPFPGKLYNSLDSLEQDIITLVQNHPQVYTQFQESFVALQHHYSIEHVARLMNSQVKMSS